MRWTHGLPGGGDRGARENGSRLGTRRVVARRTASWGAAQAVAARAPRIAVCTDKLAAVCLCAVLPFPRRLSSLLPDTHPVAVCLVRPLEPDLDAHGASKVRRRSRRRCCVRHAHASPLPVPADESTWAQNCGAAQTPLSCPINMQNGRQRLVAIGGLLLLAAVGLWAAGPALLQPKTRWQPTVRSFRPRAGAKHVLVTVGHPCLNGVTAPAAGLAGGVAGAAVLCSRGAG